MSTDYDDAAMPTEVGASLKEFLRRSYPDWDERWRKERYFVRYRIGEVEEVLSFTPSEIADAMRVATLALSDLIVTDETDDACILVIQPSRDDNSYEVDPWRYIDELRREGMNAVETFVRCKHGLEHARNTRGYRRLMKRLVRTNPSRRNEEQRDLWSGMVFGMVMAFLLYSPPGDDWLEVDDLPLGEEILEGAKWNPDFTEDVIARKKLDAIELGGREYHSTQVPASLH